MKKSTPEIGVKLGTKMSIGLEFFQKSFCYHLVEICLDD